jgi:hypothetical protein
MTRLYAINADSLTSHLCIIFVIVVLHQSLSYIRVSKSSSLQQPLDIRQPTGLDIIAFALLLAKGQAHQLSLVPLDDENIVLNGPLNHEAEDTAVLLLAESVDTINSLVLDGGRSPTVGEDDLVCTREVQSNSAYTQGCQHDGGIFIILESAERLIAAMSRHGPVDAAELVAFLLQARLNDVKETRLLAEDDSLVFLCLGCSKNGHH